MSLRRATPCGRWSGPQGLSGGLLEEAAGEVIAGGCDEGNAWIVVVVERVGQSCGGRRSEGEERVHASGPSDTWVDKGV